MSEWPIVPGVDTMTNLSKRKKKFSTQEEPPCDLIGPEGAGAAVGTAATQVWAGSAWSRPS